MSATCPPAPFPAEIRMPDRYWKPGATERVVNITRKVAEADAVVVLARSGALAYWVIVGCGQAMGIELPPAITVLVGREISYDFEFQTDMMLNDYAHRVREDTSLPLHVAGDERVEAYYRWLEKQARRQTSQVSRVITQLREARASLGEVRDITIVDDSVYQGPTLYMTAPFVVQRIFPEAAMRTVALYVADSDEILEANFPHLNQRWHENRAERYMVRTLMLGIVERRGRLVPLDATYIYRVGARISRNSKWQNTPTPPNPAPILARRYGLEIVLALHRMTVEALLNYGGACAGM